MPKIKISYVEKIPKKNPKGLESLPFSV